MRSKRRPLPFDKAGGVIVLQRLMLECEAWLQLSAQAKALMTLMQIHWRNESPVAYGVREAAEKIPCSRKTAMKAFDELADAGFIKDEGGMLFDPRGQRKSRNWRLTWLPFKNEAPSNDWKK